MKYILALGICAVGMFAQTPTPSPTSSFAVGIGGGYNAAGLAGSAQKAAALVEFAYQPGTTAPNGSNVWIALQFLTQPGKTNGLNTLRAELGYSLKKTGNFNLILVGDAGSAITTVNTLGTVGGGLRLRYDLGGISKGLAGLGIMPGFRVAAVAGTSIAPEYTLILNKRF